MNYTCAAREEACGCRKSA